MINNLCGYPPCSIFLPNKKIKKELKVENESLYCSSYCAKASILYNSQLSQEEFDIRKNRDINTCLILTKAKQKYYYI